MKTKIICLILVVIGFIFQINVYAAGTVSKEKNITMTVNDEDGTEKTYTFSVVELENLESTNTKLKKLKVEGYDLYPEFREETYGYNLTINKIVENLQVIAETENENAKVEIIGNKNLKKGNNTIKIIVTAEDGVTKGEYSINTYISDFTVEVHEENKKTAILAIIILSSLIVYLFIYLIKKHKNSV